MLDATPIHSQTERVVCSDDWQDIVIIYIPQLNDTPIEENYADISLKEIKDTYLKNTLLSFKFQLLLMNYALYKKYTTYGTQFSDLKV